MAIILVIPASRCHPSVASGHGWRHYRLLAFGIHQLPFLQRVYKCHHACPQHHGVLAASHIRSWPAIITARGSCPPISLTAGREWPSSSSSASRPPPSVSRQVVNGHHHGQGFSTSHRLTAGRERSSSSSSKRHGLPPASRQAMAGGTIGCLRSGFASSHSFRE